MKKIFLFIVSWISTLGRRETPNCSGGFKIACVPQNHFAKIGEQIKFKITSREKIPCSITLTVDGGRVLKVLEDVTVPQTITYTTEFPGFIRCSVRADGVKADSAVAVAPEKIKAVGQEPEDLDAFWKKTFEESDSLPLDIQSQKLDCRDNFNCSVISCANINGRRAYGLLAIPQNIRKPVPLLVSFSGGEAFYTENDLPNQAKDAAKILKREIAVLLLHLPPYAPAKNYRAAEKRHQEFLKEIGNVGRYLFYQDDRKETFYARSAVTGCLKLLEHTANLKEIDKKNIVFFGASHGGKIGAYLACFSPRLKAAFCGVPSSCEFQAMNDNRSSSALEEWRDKLDVINYYDLVWYAKRIKIPLFVSVGFVDTACPPTGVYAFYNALRCPKQLYNKVEDGHAGAPPDYKQKIWKFIADNFDN